MCVGRVILVRWHYKMSNGLSATSIHRRDMTEKWLEATKNPTHTLITIHSVIKKIWVTMID